MKTDSTRRNPEVNKYKAMKAGKEKESKSKKVKNKQTNKNPKEIVLENEEPIYLCQLSVAMYQIRPKPTAI